MSDEDYATGSPVAVAVALKVMQYVKESNYKTETALRARAVEILTEYLGPSPVAFELADPPSDE